MSLRDLDAAKARARTLRAALAEAGTPVSHARALELVAQEEGARDWNTLHARLSRPPELSMGGRVEGAYLGQPFTGRVTELTELDAGHRLVLRLDKPVDTVRFASFSNLRQVIRGTIGPEGESAERTSDGVPQLVVRAVRE